MVLVDNSKIPDGNTKLETGKDQSLGSWAKELDFEGSRW